MSVVVNQRNRAVSQAAIDAIASARRYAPSNLFALPGGNNVLSGAYATFTSLTDSGWWGNVLSNADGLLPTPAIMTVTKRISAYEFQLRGYPNNFPVDFVLVLYRNGIAQYSKAVSDNTIADLHLVLDKAYDIDSYTLTITRISKAHDVLKVVTASFDSSLTNLMKEPGRRIRGKVEVMYSNALQTAAELDNNVPESGVIINEGAHGSSGESLTDTITAAPIRFFKLYDNVLDGSCKVIGETSAVGWWPKTLPTGVTYATPQVLSLRFSTRNIYGLSIHGDATSGDYPVDYSVDLYSAGSKVQTLAVSHATGPVVSFADTFYDIDGLDITVTTVSRPNKPAVITEVSIVTSIVYDADKLVSIDLLEELSYEDAIEKLGGVSANELTVVFSNEDKSFYFNNDKSPVAGYLKKNRRVRAWFGVDIPGSTETIWSPLGTYWTHDWDIPVGSLTAKTVAFDTIGLLGTRKYYDHQVYRNKSVGWLIDTVLNSAKAQIRFLDWRVEDELYDLIIPVAWFNYGSYAAALNRIASCDFINIYCDRDGRIIATRRLSGVLSPDDVWSDATNIINTRYPTLNTALPNYIDVKVSRVVSTSQDVLEIVDSYAVSAGDVRLFNFSSPAETIENLVINTTATYSYEVFSWGLRITFLSDGVLQGISVKAKALTVDTPTSVHKQDVDAIEEDGIVPCEISSDFIQSVEHATAITNYLYDKLAVSVYDVEVNYRGDISVSLNSKISLPEGIAPNNLYVIKRHELHWNGALSGSAKLST